MVKCIAMTKSRSVQLVLVVCAILICINNVVCEDAEEEIEDETSNTGMDSQGIYDFMISTKALSAIPFHGSDLIIYEHPSNVPDDKMHPDNRFYVMPVVEIDAKSLNVRHSWLVNAYRLDFNLVLWTDDLKNAAIEDLEGLYADFDEVKGEPKHLTMNQIQMIPMEEVRLIWNSEIPLPDGIWLSRDWIPFSRNPHQLHFSFMCEVEDDCLKLKAEMEQHPAEFRKLNLEFTTTVKASASREIRITGTTLTTNKIFREMQTNDKFPGGEEGIRYMTAEDLQNLSVEVTENYVATTITDAEYVPTQQSISIAELIYNRLASTKVSTAAMTQQAWNSLKWEPDFARPDKVASQLNDITNVVQAQNGSKYLEINETAFNNADHNYAYAREFDQVKSYQAASDSSVKHDKGCDSSRSSSGGSASFRFGWFRGSASGYHNAAKSSCHSLFNAKSTRSASDFQETSSGANVEKTDVGRAGLNNWQVATDKFNNYMSDQSSYIEFNGEKFVHKPMDLYKMVMSDLTENVNIATTDMQVQKLQKIYHIKVAISSEITSTYRSELDIISESIKNLTNTDAEQSKELDIKLASLEEALRDEQNALKELQENMHLNLSNSLNELNNLHADLRQDVDENLDNLGPGDVSFMASLRYNKYFSYNEIVKFDQVDINLNNCFDISDGTFRSPTNGLYLFYFSLDFDNTNTMISVYTYVDNVRFLSVYDYGTSFNGGAYSVRQSMYKYSRSSYKYVSIGSPAKQQNPSATFMLQLNQGQTVHLQLSSSGQLDGSYYRYSWFGGHLIKKL